MYNKITLIGNLGADPEVSQTKSGTPVVKLRVATFRNYKKDDEWQTDTTWHTAIAWRKLAENLDRFHKGDMILVEGEMSYREWQDKDGNKRTSPEIVATSIRMVKKREDSSGASSSAKPEPIASDDYPF